MVRAELAHGVRTEDEEENPERGEDPGLDHSHSVQQRADRRGSHHGRGQPTVQRHQRVLGESEQEQSEDHEEQRGLFGNSPGRQDPAALEVQGSGHVVGEDDRGDEEHFRRPQKIDDVLAGARPGLGGLLVTHEWIGYERQGLIEQKQREEVRRERHADGGGKRESEAGESSASVRAL